MRAIVGWVARVGLGIVVFLLALAVLRWGPVFAAAPFDARALPLAPWAVVLAGVVAWAGRDRRPGPVRPLAVGLAAAVAALAFVVIARGRAGLICEAHGPSGPLGRLPAGPVDVVGEDLAGLPRVRRFTLQCAGTLRAPETGTFRFWAEGRGQVELSLDGRRIVEAEGDPLRAGTEVALAAGPHRLEVRLDRVGPGPRLRLGWSRPGRDGRPVGGGETIPPRVLGETRSGVLWVLTDGLALAVAALLAALVLAVPWERPRALPTPSPVTRAQILASLAGHTALVVLMSWPLALDPAGSGVVDRPDGRLNAWILAWDAHALLREPASLFQAPIFHPLPDTLAFSENLLLPALLAAPAGLAGEPVLGYNLILMISAVASGLGAQLLARRAGAGGLGAFVGGALFAVGAHRWIRLAHLHVQVTAFLPFVLLAFDRFWERRTLRRALAVGLLLALQAWSSIYLGAIAALALTAAAGVAVLGGLSGKELLRLAAGLALAGLLLAPAARPYLRMRAFQGMEWSLEDVATYATTPESYAASGTRLYGALTRRHLDPERVQDTLFPGLVPLVLGLVGIASAPRRYRLVGVAASALAIVVSLGPETALYRLLHEHVVFVRGLRALSRFSLVPVLTLAVFAGLALARRPRLALLALPLALVEAGQVPLRWAPYAGPPAVARWLAARPGAVAYLPLGERDTEAMLDGVAHFRPLLNGDSGFLPRPYSRAMELLAGPLDGEALRLLRAVGVRQVVARDAYDLPQVARFGDDRVYDLAAGDIAALVPRARPRPTAWREDGVLVDLGRVEPVERVVFELSDAPWIARPNVELSVDGITWVPVEARASLADATLSLYADPRHGRGEVRFRAVTARYLRLDRRLPARPGVLEVPRAGGV